MCSFSNERNISNDFNGLVSNEQKTPDLLQQKVERVYSIEVSDCVFKGLYSIAGVEPLLSLIESIKV